MVRLKRAYEPVEPDDGRRVLVERLWPRGVRKADAHLDDWLKDIAPSDALRKWFHHDPSRWPEFEQRYVRELDCETARAAFDGLVRAAASETVTLVYSSHDEEHNSAVILKRMIDRRLRQGSRKSSRPASRSRAHAAHAAHGRH
jgi:uncharacterized protein YeaO (DUF488 family)